MAACCVLAMAANAINHRSSPSCHVLLASLLPKKATGSVELLGIRAADTVDQATWKLSWAQGHGRGS